MQTEAALRRDCS